MPSGAGEDAGEASTRVEGKSSIGFANSLLATGDVLSKEGGSTNRGNVGAVGGERRREAGTVGINIAVFGVEAAVVVSRVVPVCNTRVSGSEDDTHTLESKFHPFTALSLLVELWKCAFDLAIGNRDDVALGRSTALKWAGVSTQVGIGILWIKVRLVSTLVTAVGIIQCIQKDVECADRVNVDTITALIQADLLRVDDGICGLEIKSTFDDISFLGLSLVRGLSAINRNKLWYQSIWDLGRCVVLEEDLEIWKVEVVGPLGNAHNVAAVVVLRNRDVVDGTQAVNGDQSRAV